MIKGLLVIDNMSVEQFDEYLAKRPKLANEWLRIPIIQTMINPPSARLIVLPIDNEDRDYGDECDCNKCSDYYPYAFRSNTWYTAHID